MIKLVIFDWNGTLFADAKVCLEAHNHALKKLGVKPISLGRFRETFTVPLTNLFVANGAKKEKVLSNPELIAKTFHDFYEPRIKRTRTRHGSKKILKWLDENEIKIVILSNHVKEKISDQLKRLKIDYYFQEVLANNQTSTAYKTNPKRERLEKFMGLNKLTSDQVILVGDALEEIEIGRDIGVKSVAITGGFCSTRRLKAAKPDYLISDLGQIINIVRKINS